MNRLRNTKVIPGQIFGRLTAIRPERFNKYIKWHCQCSCGNTTVVYSNHLYTGFTRSCGCFNKERTSERLSKHKKCQTTEYKSWSGMITRCYSINNKKYRIYGQRGITVDSSWRHSFETFLLDMGLKPSPIHTLDRINNNEGYSKDNCRWATPKEQSRNNSRNIRIKHNGHEFTTMTECIEKNVSTDSKIISRISTRISRGWDIAEALSTPSKRGKYALSM